MGIPGNVSMIFRKRTNSQNWYKKVDLSRSNFFKRKWKEVDLYEIMVNLMLLWYELGLFSL